MPAGAVEQDNGVASGCDVATDLGEMQVHRLAVGGRQDESSDFVARWADSAEQISPIVALVARCARPAAALGPDTGQGALLADAGLILPPKLDRLVARIRGDGGSDQIGKVFLCAS